MKKLVIALLILSCRVAVAQTCTGGLGDPIVDISFGSGTGFGAALAPGITNMTYIQDPCPSDGYYTIVNRTSGCFGNTWLNVASDHTGNPNGYFMLINASYQPSDFYVQTISGLCAGTTYQFAAWILNMAAFTGQILPNITFTIEGTDGTVLGSYTTGNIPALTTITWIQYALYFNTPPGVSTVVLRMTNNATGGNGNDLAIDDITFRAAGPSILVTGSAGFSDDSISLCQPDPRTIVFAATVQNCYPTAVYQWQQSTDGGADWTDIPGATATAYLRGQTGVGSYQYRLTVAQAGNIGISACEVASEPATVQVIATPSPAVTIESDTNSICAGMPVIFTANPTDGGNGPVYQWMVDGSVAGTGASYTSSTLASTDVVTCELTSNASCVLTPTALSNPLSITVNPNVLTAVDITGSANNICQDSVVVFTATPFNGGSDPSYQWAVNGAAQGSNSAVFPDPGLNNGDIVNCTMTGSIVCSSPVTASQPITMTVYPMPVVQLTPDTVIAGGQSVRLNPMVGLPINSGLVDSIAVWQWGPATWLDNPAIPDPLATPEASITYELTATTSFGCRASAKEIVGVFYSVQMPGAFSPNGDGHNDLFRVPPQVPISVMHLVVYNRLGALVFSTSNVGVGWDGRFNGRAQPTGEYVWVLDYENPLSKKMETAKGTVMIVR
jgi:gliding motility-associated-like protein